MIGWHRSNTISVFFFRDGINEPLYLEDLFGNLGNVLPVFNEEKIEEEIGGHVVSKCKDDEFKDAGGANFGFMEEILDVSWP